jgi:hypothetical protein
METKIIGNPTTMQCKNLNITLVTSKLTMQQQLQPDTLWFKHSIKWAQLIT